MIDLRSDTVTRPTPGMLRAMMRAKVGDDVLGDDPTVIRLEEMAAEFLGQARALFMPSGSMANTAAIKSWTQPGDEVILDKGAHSVNYEVGAGAAICGVMFHTLDMPDGILTPASVESAIRPSNIHQPQTRLVCVENTHNRAGGTCYSLERVRELRALTKERGLRLHMDGARLVNAAAVTGGAPREYGRLCDSVSQCLSKGLGCPVGTMLAGPPDFIERARRCRKMLGGGMRQAGYLAAAGIYALRHHVERVVEDHANARRLAGGLAEIPGIEINPAQFVTNLIYFRFKAGPRKAQETVAALKSKGILIMLTAPDRARAVTHLDVSARDITLTLRTLKRLLG
jgi:threonine aldolase